MSVNDTQRLGRLILIPNTLDLGCVGGEGQPPLPDLREVLPMGAITLAANLQHWVCENAKTTRAFLKRVADVCPLTKPLQEMDIQVLPRPAKGDKQTAATPSKAKGPGAATPGGSPKDAGDTLWRQLLQPALAGQDVGLISEAGLPGVADPGAALVLAAHRCGVPVLPVSGPSSLVLAMAASGLQGQSFAFVGYLPTDPALRATRIKELEQASRRARQTQLVIETPYRNAALWDALVRTLQADTLLSVSCGLTLEQGFCRTDTVARWRQTSLSLPGDTPAVFSWLAA